MSSGGAFLLSSKSYLVVGVLLFFEEFTLLGCLLACFLRRVVLHAVLSALASSKVYFTCGVAWLVGLLGLWRGDLLSLAFSVSINKLKIYE